MPLKSILLCLAASGVLAAGCGSASGGRAPDRAPAGASTSTGLRVGADDLERQLGVGFRDALYRRAVMDQRGDDTADLGQPLPTGLVDLVACAPHSPRPASTPWRCTVRWRTVSARRRRVSYDIRTRGACFSAGAVPRRAQRYDATTRAYAEDPINAIVSVRRGC